MLQRAASNQSNNSLFLHLLVFLVLLSCFACLCCFEEKSNRFSLMRQRLTLFHVSHQVFVRTVGPNLGAAMVQGAPPNTDGLGVRVAVANQNLQQLGSRIWLWCASSIGRLFSTATGDDNSYGWSIRWDV
jgi:hypothetical protein